MIGFSDPIKIGMRQLSPVALREGIHRWYIAIETLNLPHGGTEYITQLFESKKSIQD